MRFRDDRARKDGNLFVVAYDTYTKEKNMDPDKGFYVSIKPKEGTWISTIYTRRFAHFDDAAAFCEDIAAGKYTLESLRQEFEMALTKIKADKDLQNQNKASELLDTLADLGVSYSTASKIFKAMSGVTGDYDVLSHCEKLSKDRPDPEKLIHENIVNITCAAHEKLLTPGVDLDAHGGFTGLTDFIISTAKKYEQEVGRHTDFESPDAPSYWESIDAYADSAIRAEYDLNPALSQRLSEACQTADNTKSLVKTNTEERGLEA